MSFSCITDTLCDEGFTLAVWMYLRSRTEKVYEYILDSVGLSSQTGDGGVSIHRHANTEVVVGILHRNTGTQGTLWQYRLTLEDKQWVHLAITWRKNGAMNVFVNGNKQDDTTGSPATLSAPQGNGTMYLGKQKIKHDNYANVTLDELYIWPFEKTQREVRRDISSGK